MALGTITKNAAESGNVSKALNFDTISFLGDGAYTTGGTVAFDAAIKTLTKDGRNVIGVIPGDCGGFIPVYSAGKLKVFRAGATNAALEEVPNAADLSGTTFNLLVVSR
jgi:hypothetical protein